MCYLLEVHWRLSRKLVGYWNALDQAVPALLCQAYNSFKEYHILVLLRKHL